MEPAAMFEKTFGELRNELKQLIRSCALHQLEKCEDVALRRLSVLFNSSLKHDSNDNSALSSSVQQRKLIIKKLKWALPVS
jgi:hypothetical protein